LLNVFRREHLSVAGSGKCAGSEDQPEGLLLHPNFSTVLSGRNYFLTAITDGWETCGPTTFATFELIIKLVLSQPPFPIGLHAQIDLNLVLASGLTRHRRRR
jgi:hypothetical protein